jgi:hypothetical protein
MAMQSSRVDKRSASTMPAQKGGCAALIHPAFFAENIFTLILPLSHLRNPIIVCYVSRHLTVDVSQMT